MQPGFLRTLNTRLLQPCKSGFRHPSLIWPAISRREKGNVLKQHLAIHLKEPMRTLEASPDLMNFICQAIDDDSHSCFRLGYLYDICLRIRPERVVETGVHHGVSTAFILKALKETGRGRLYSIDLPNVEYQTDNQSKQNDVLLGPETGFLVPQDLRVNWDLLTGDSRKLLPTLLRSIGPIDIFHHDSMHTYDHMKFEFETAWPHLRDGGLLLSDDVNWSKAFEDFCRTKKLDYRIHEGIGIVLKGTL